jgi:hypothetical protein
VRRPIAAFRPFVPPSDVSIVVVVVAVDGTVARAHVYVPVAEERSPRRRRRRMRAVSAALVAALVAALGAAVASTDAADEQGVVVAEGADGGADTDGGGRLESGTGVVGGGFGLDIGGRGRGDIVFGDRQGRGGGERRGRGGWCSRSHG